MEQAAEVCVDLEYYVILNNANEDVGGRLDTAAGENQGGKTKSCSVVMSPDSHPLKANEVENMNTAASVMVLIDEGPAAGDFIIGGGGGKEKRKKAKKPPKPPPQPHRGDHQKKLMIKELAELAMIKRARIERMKALIIQKKAAPSKNPSSSSGGNLFAMLFTILVFLVLLFQGMSCQISCGTFTGSPPTTPANESSFIFIHEELNPSAHDSV